LLASDRKGGKKGCSGLLKKGKERKVFIGHRREKVSEICGRHLPRGKEKDTVKV